MAYCPLNQTSYFREAVLVTPAKYHTPEVIAFSASIKYDLSSYKTGVKVVLNLNSIEDWIIGGRYRFIRLSVRYKLLPIS